MGAAAITVFLVALATDPASELLPSDPVAQFVDEAADWLLSGQALPRDYRPRLLAMEPADRLHAIAYLRRTGLLTGTSWPVSDLLRPSNAVKETEE